MEKKRALFVLRATRRIVAMLSVVLIAFSMTTLIASAAPPSTSSEQALEITAEQFMREAAATNAGSSEFLSMFSRVNANVLAQQCCKICSAGKACGDTCIARDKTCRIGPGCACDG